MFLGSFRDISRAFPESVRVFLYFKEVKRCVREVLMVFQEVSKKFLECLKTVSRVFQDSFKGVSRKIEGCFKGDFSEFQGYLKKVERNSR